LTHPELRAHPLFASPTVDGEEKSMPTLHANDAPVQKTPQEAYAARLRGEGLLDVQDKASGAHLGSVGIALDEHVDAAVGAATQAQVSWAHLPPVMRGDVLRKFVVAVERSAADIATQIVRETGSIRAKADWEVAMTCREVLEAAALCSAPSGHLLATAVVGRESVARRIPIGLVGVITPWNSPFLLAARAVAPALAMGNGVLLKPDPNTPICGGLWFADLFEEAGLPAGLFHVLPGGAQTGDLLVRHPGVKMVSFTGSTRAGRAIGATAGQMLKRVSLELGGNNPVVVLDDADLEGALAAGAWGSFFHQGQICLTSGRHIVDSAMYDNYISGLAKRAQALTVGDPYTSDVQLGPIINERQAANLDRILTKSVAMGARLVCGGEREGLFFRPTVLADVQPGMPAFDEEIFGPIAAVTRAVSDEDAASLANCTDYGLAAAVFSRDIARARRVADAIHAGIVHINDQTVLHEVFGPIGGVGSSGNGFNHSTLTNADQFTEWQWMTVRTDVPSYPF
jgi:benzaldehyde dehydrogenase (NAD)